MTGAARVHVFRLHRGEDLRGGIEAYAAQHGIGAAAVASCAGCVSCFRLRGADGATVHEGEGRFEIVSLTGTVSANGCHLHVAFAGEDLRAFGGHLLAGCTVNTTAEIVLLQAQAMAFERAYDSQTGYRELVIREDAEGGEESRRDAASAL